MTHKCIVMTDSVWGPISPSYFLLLPSISLEWNTLPWLVALLWIDSRRVIQFCFPLGIQPSACRSYRGFTEVIIALKSFPAVSGTVAIRDSNHLSELQVGLWELLKSNVFTCVFGCSFMGQRKLLGHIFWGNAICVIQVLLERKGGYHFKAVKWCYQNQEFTGDECKTPDLHLSEQGLPLISL